MNRWLTCSAAAAAAAMSVGALAQSTRPEPPIGSRLGDRLEKKPVENERDSAQVAHQLAGCILAKKGSAGRELLKARSEKEVEKLSSRIRGDYECFAVLLRGDLVEGVRISYPPEVMRGHLAEALLKKNRSAVGQLQPLPIEKVYSRPWFAFSGRHVSVDEMAACVADTNPAAIMALLEADPFSQAEDAAFGNLVPFMGPCLQAGTKVDAKREPLRAALAEALYQRTENPGERAVGPAQSAATAQAE